MKYLKSLSLIFILGVALITISPNPTNAHSTTCLSGSEIKGYVVNCTSPGHAGTRNIKYRYNNVPTRYQGYTSTGVNRWNNTGVVSISFSASTLIQNVVQTYHDNNTSTVASVTSYYNSTTRHKTRWTMKYNETLMMFRSDAQNNGTAAHEFGHTIGLADLYNSSNNNKLMYGYSSRTIGFPTGSDIAGAKEAIK